MERRGEEGRGGEEGREGREEEGRGVKRSGRGVQERSEEREEKRRTIGLGEDLRGFSGNECAGGDNFRC
mgnify:CR=1 FL=1